MKRMFPILLLLALTVSASAQDKPVTLAEFLPEFQD